MFIVAKEESGQTVHYAIVRNEAEAWEFASQLLEEKEDIKRVVFYNDSFAFVNALSKPGHLKHEDDVISEEDKQELLTLQGL